MKKRLNYKFHNLDLQEDITRIIDNFKENPENLEDSLPNVADIGDNGEGDPSFYLDVRNTEESYWYANSEERDEDYKKLMQLIDLLFLTN